MTCRSEGFWDLSGSGLFLNHGYSPGAEILQNICFNYKKITVWLFINLCTKDSSLPENFFVISEET